MGMRGTGTGPSKSGAGHSKSGAGHSILPPGHFILPPGHNDRVSHFKHLTKSAARQPSRRRRRATPNDALEGLRREKAALPERGGSFRDVLPESVRVRRPTGIGRIGHRADRLGGVAGVRREVAAAGPRRQRRAAVGAVVVGLAGLRTDLRRPVAAGVLIAAIRFRAGIDRPCV